MAEEIRDKQIEPDQEPHGIETGEAGSAAASLRQVAKRLLREELAQRKIVGWTLRRDKGPASANWQELVELIDIEAVSGLVLDELTEAAEAVDVKALTVEEAGDELTDETYGALLEVVKKIYEGLDTPEHHLAYVRAHLAAAQAGP